MNERINQLLSQAYDQAVPETWTELSSEQLGRIYEKFAELIVRECVASIPADGHRGDFGRAVEFCQQQILEHFGVEE